MQLGFAEHRKTVTEKKYFFKRQTFFTFWRFLKSLTFFSQYFSQIFISAISDNFLLFFSTFRFFPQIKFFLRIFKSELILFAVALILSRMSLMFLDILIQRLENNQTFLWSTKDVWRAGSISLLISTGEIIQQLSF